MEKSLLPVNGKPIVRYIVENLLASNSVRTITIACIDKFKKHFEHEFRDLDIIIKSFPQPVGTFNCFIDALQSQPIPTLTESVLVHYADCVTEIDYESLVNEYLMRKRISNPNHMIDGMIAVTKQVKHDYSEVVLDGDGMVKVAEFNEKPYIGSWTWSGIGIFDVLEMINRYQRKEIGTDFAFDIFPQMIEKNTLDAFTYNGFWFDCGNLNSYMKICKLLGEGNGNGNEKCV